MNIPQNQPAQESGSFGKLAFSSKPSIDVTKIIDEEAQNQEEVQSSEHQDSEMENLEETVEPTSTN